MVRGAQPRTGRIGSVAAAAGAPWLVLLQGLGVFWERRRRRKG